MGFDVPFGIERYTEPARRALFFARLAAGRLGAAAIEPEHVLAGLLRDTNTVALRVLEGHGVDVQHLDTALEARGPGGRELSASVEIAVSPAMEQTLRGAVEEADRLGQDDVGTGHILLSVLRNEDESVKNLLSQHGLYVSNIADSVLKFAAETLEPRNGRLSPSNWRRITSYVPSDHVHIEYSGATPEHRPWRNVAGVRWGAYGYTLGELVEIAWGAPATLAPAIDATQRYDVEIVLPRSAEIERTLARVRAAIESQLGVHVEQTAGHPLQVRRSG